MSFPQIRLRPLLCLILTVSLSTASLLLGQTPTPTPPVDTDGDGVPNHQDGWPQHKQLSSPRVPESHYVVINLGHGIGYGVNSFGDVVGYALNDNFEREAILWRPGQPRTLLGFLTQDQTFERWSIAWGINDARQITGRSDYTWDPNVSGEYPDPPTYPVWDYSSAIHAFLWQAGAMTDLNDLSLGQPVNPNLPDPRNKLDSEGRAINRDGVVVGYSQTNASAQNTGSSWHIVYDAPHAVKFNGAAPVELGTPPIDATSDATAINDHGAIVGGGNYQGAFFQLNGQTQLLAPVAGFAFGLNNLDHVVGALANSQAFIWVPTSTLPENERVIDLTAMNQAESIAYSAAAAINDRDQIVGSGNGSALLWQNGKVHRLIDRVSLRPNVYLANATAINQRGMIVANTANDEEGEAILLVPDELMVDANKDVVYKRGRA